MTVQEPQSQIELLLVENDPGDAAMTRQALLESTISFNVHEVTNGEEALAYLQNESPFAESPRPDLVLVDLNLPRISGRELLSIVKSDPDLRRIPIVIFTKSESEEDVLRSYDLHANAYVTKPDGFESFVNAVQQIGDFFLSTVQLPPR